MPRHAAALLAAAAPAAALLPAYTANPRLDGLDFYHFILSGEHANYDARAAVAAGVRDGQVFEHAIDAAVEIGAELSGGRFFITDGLAPGDRVVEFGSVPFAPGQTVQIARTRRLQQERVGR